MDGELQKVRYHLLEFFHRCSSNERARPFLREYIDYVRLFPLSIIFLFSFLV